MKKKILLKKTNRTGVPRVTMMSDDDELLILDDDDKGPTESSSRLKRKAVAGLAPNDGPSDGEPEPSRLKPNPPPTQEPPEPSRLKPNPPPVPPQQPLIIDDNAFAGFFNDEDEEAPPPEQASVPGDYLIDSKLATHHLVYRHAHTNAWVANDRNSRPVKKFRELMDNANFANEQAELKKIWKRYKDLAKPMENYSRDSSNLSRSTSNAWPDALNSLAQPSARAFFDMEALEDPNEDESEGKKQFSGGNLNRTLAAIDGDDELDRYQATHEDHYVADGFVVHDDDDDGAEAQEGKRMEEMDFGELESLLADVATQREKAMQKSAKLIKRLEAKLETQMEKLDEQEALIELIITRKRENVAPEDIGVVTAE